MIKLVYYLCFHHNFPVLFLTASLMLLLCSADGNFDNGNDEGDKSMVDDEIIASGMHCITRGGDVMESCLGQQSSNACADTTKHAYHECVHSLINAMKAQQMDNSTIRRFQRCQLLAEKAVILDAFQIWSKLNRDSEELLLAMDEGQGNYLSEMSMCMSGELSDKLKRVISGLDEYSLGSAARERFLSVTAEQIARGKTERYKHTSRKKNTGKSENQDEFLPIVILDVDEQRRPSENDGVDLILELSTYTPETDGERIIIYCNQKAVYNIAARPDHRDQIHLSRVKRGVNEYQAVLTDIDGFQIVASQPMSVEVE